MAGEIEARLKALDLVLPEVTAPVADYVSYLHLSGQLFIAGQLPLKDGKIAFAGTIGSGVDVAQGQEAARLCALNILAQAKAALGEARALRAALAAMPGPAPAEVMLCPPATLVGAGSRIVVVTVRGRVIGLIVDSVMEVLRIPKATIEPPPSLGSTAGAEFIQGVGKINDRLLTLLDLNRLLTPEESSALAKS